jgi:hypothetical protein
MPAPEADAGLMNQFHIRLRALGAPAYAQEAWERFPWEQALPQDDFPLAALASPLDGHSRPGELCLRVAPDEVGLHGCYSASALGDSPLDGSLRDDLA